MSGRARGRGAGRGRARNADVDQPVRRPGETAEVAEDVQVPQSSGRGRGRRTPATNGGQDAVEQFQNLSLSNQPQASACKQNGNQQTRSYKEQGARPKEVISDGNRLNQQGGLPRGVINDDNHLNQQGPRPGEVISDDNRPNQQRVQQREQSGNYDYQGSEQRDIGQRERVSEESRRTRPETCRVKTGNSGRPIEVVTNAFCVESTVTEWILYQYHVEFNPPVESKRVKIAMIADHKDLVGDTRAFDGMTLFIPRRLPQKVSEVYSTLRSDGTQVRITITLTKELPPTSPDCLRIYNIIFRRAQKMLGNEEIGRNYFNPSLKTRHQQYHIDIMPGFMASIQKFEAANLLIVDVIHKVAQTKTVLEQMYELYQRHGQDINNFWRECYNDFVGAVVITKYNNKTYMVDDIASDGKPTDTFTLHNGESITYLDYYKKQYSIDDLDEEQPLLISKPKKKDVRGGPRNPIYLLPQLCIVTGLTKEMKSDFRMKTSIQTLTRVAPNKRVQNLTDFIQQINTHKEVQEVMTGWNLRIPNNLLTLRGRILDKERVFQRNKELDYPQDSADWSRFMRGNILTTPVNITNWIVVFYNRNRAETHDLVHALERVGRAMGINFEQPQRIELVDDRNTSYLSALKENVKANTQLTMCVLPTAKEDRYNAIKKFCCVDHPVPSQVVLKRTVARKENLLSVATKIAMQLNCKLGGELWTSNMPNVTGGLMVVGIDTYHQRGEKSVGGFVCSLNQNCTRYYSGVTFQMQRQEILDGLSIKMAEGLKKYHEINNHLPAKIIVYRDGVGDGQLGIVQDHEIKQLYECFQKFSGYSPKLAVVIVKKRINQRFFIKEGPSHNNPRPGTIIDTGVTKEEWFDFFLVSQSVRQGTVSPTHYNIIHDTICVSPDLLQKMTYRLCHLYYNWPGTIRVPAPCQYAHKLAYLVGQNIKRDPHPALADRLFFL